MPGPKWALIDCYLPSSEALNQFYEFADHLKIDRLELIILTHPHHDHYAGMADVINHFTSNGRSVGKYCNSGISMVDVARFLEFKNKPAEEIKEYVRLVKTITPLIANGTIGLVVLDENHNPINVYNGDEFLQIIPIAPETGMQWVASIGALENKKTNANINDFCIILIIQTYGKKARFQALLASDANEGPLKRSMQIWEHNEKRFPDTMKFDFVKVPHHGSAKGHWAGLCEMGRRGIAAISVGLSYDLPKRGVIADYQRYGWKVIATAIRLSPSKHDRLIGQFNRKPEVERKVSQQDLVVRWSESLGLNFVAVHGADCLLKTG